MFYFYDIKIELPTYIVAERACSVEQEPIILGFGPQATLLSTSTYPLAIFIGGKT